MSVNFTKDPQRQLGRHSSENAIHWNKISIPLLRVDSVKEVQSKTSFFFTFIIKSLSIDRTKGTGEV